MAKGIPANNREARPILVSKLLIKPKEKKIIEPISLFIIDFFWKGNRYFGIVISFL